MRLEDFEKLVLQRRAVRHFKPDPIPNEMVNRLLDSARWAPSGYNLQPTHFFVVTDPALKEKLTGACLNQKQVSEAPVVVVFTGDRRVVENHFEIMLAGEREAGIISSEYEKTLRKYVPLAFSHAPWGLGWLWKAVLIPIIRLFRPVPEIPAVHKRFWLAKQGMLSAMVFMLAATAEGLATVPMEGFDEKRVKELLQIPNSYVVLLVVPVGFAADGNLIKTRLPLKELTHWNRW